MSMPKLSAGFAFPATATSPILVSGKSDHSLRKLVYDFFTVSARMEDVRRHLGNRIGLTGPQYSLMMAVAELQGNDGVSVGRVAEYLHVTGTFVTTESGKLSEKGFLEKYTNVHDRRSSLLSIAPKGEKALHSLFEELQQINDIFFELDSRADFKELCALLDRLLGNSQRALALINATLQDPRLTLNGNGVGISKQR
jgi:MarR family transcriptional regulator, organic hydroperoxide resistance regulator